MAYETPQEEKLSYFNIAKEVGLTAAFWPVTGYIYDPGRYSISRGQIRLPFSGQGVRKWGKLLRHFPVYGNSWVNSIKSTFNIDTQSAVMQSKEMWWGMGTDKSRVGLGVTAMVDKVPSALKPDMSTIGSPGLYKFQRALEWKPTVESPAYQKRLRYVPSMPKNINLPIRQSLLEYRPSTYTGTVPPWVLSDMDIKKFKLGSDTTPISPDPRGAAQKVRAARSPAFTSGLSRREAYLDLEKFKKTPRSPLYGLGGFPARETARGVGVAISRGAMRAGVAGLKGFAYYQVGKLMWDTMNFIMAPVGQAAVQSIDSAFRMYEAGSQVELGGQIAMSYLTHGASTERQRSLSAISKSQINGRSNFGQEAAYVQ